MTKVEFLKTRGAEWRRFASKEIFADLLSMIDDEGPARKAANLAATDQLHGSPVFLGEITGHERLRSMLAGLATAPDSPQDVPDKFETPEV